MQPNHRAAQAHKPDERHDTAGPGHTGDRARKRFENRRPASAAQPPGFAPEAIAASVLSFPMLPMRQGGLQSAASFWTSLAGHLLGGSDSVVEGHLVGIGRQQHLPRIQGISRTRLFPESFSVGTTRRQTGRPKRGGKICRVVAPRLGSGCLVTPAMRLPRRVSKLRSYFSDI